MISSCAFMRVLWGMSMFEVTSLQHEVALAKYEYILANNLILIITLTNSEPVQNTGCQALLLACLSQFIGRAIKQRSAIEKEKSKKCNLYTHPADSLTRNYKLLWMPLIVAEMLCLWHLTGTVIYSILKIHTETETLNIRPKASNWDGISFSQVGESMNGILKCSWKMEEHSNKEIGTYNHTDTKMYKYWDILGIPNYP